MNNFTLKGKHIHVQIDSVLFSAIIVSEPISHIDPITLKCKFEILICLANNKFMVVDIKNCHLDENILKLIG